jgi:hypothetical protein
MKFNIVALYSTLMFIPIGCGKSAAPVESTPAAVDAATQFATFHVTYYRPGDMPVECKTPPGYSFSDGIAVIEGDPLIDNARCSGFSSGLPDCTKVLREKKLCGTIIELSYQGKSRKGWLTGICPNNHPNNASKGQWNPCGMGKKNLDLMDNMFFALGLKDSNSWGPNGYTGQVNPQAAYISARKVGKVANVGTIHD